MKTLKTRKTYLFLLMGAMLSDIVYGQEATITGELPDGLKAIDRVFVRLWVKSDQSGEYYYTQTQRLDLK